MHNSKKQNMNIITNRFLPVPESVLKGLEKEPNINDFIIEKEIGVGSFGRVLLVKHKNTNIEYALKVIDKKNKCNIKGKPYFRREIEIMYKIHHINVVRLFCHFEDEEFCYFVMEYENGGNLYTYMTKTKAMEHKLIASMLKDIISAVYYLHNMDPPIIHRDIKPENVLLGENGTVKLTDFGWSNYVDDSCERNTFCGTPIYLAPEIIGKYGHDEKVDIWCIGILLFELITKKPPFYGVDKGNLMMNISNLKISWPHNIPLDAKDLISKILKIDPIQRPTLYEILQHPFFTKYFPDAANNLIKPSYTQHEPFVISRDVPKPISPYKIVKRHEKITHISKNNKNINRDITPIPINRIRLDHLTNHNPHTTRDNYDNNSGLSKTKISSNLITSRDDYEQLIEEYTVLQKQHKETLAKIENATSIKNELNRTIDTLQEKMRMQEKKNRLLINELNDLQKNKHDIENDFEMKTQSAKKPNNNFYCKNIYISQRIRTDISNSPERGELRKIKTEFAKNKEQYEKQLSSLQAEQNNFKEQLNALGKKVVNSDNEIKKLQKRIRVNEIDIEKQRIREKECLSKISSFSLNSQK